MPGETPLDTVRVSRENVFAWVDSSGNESGRVVVVLVALRGGVRQLDSSSDSTVMVIWSPSFRKYVLGSTGSPFAWMVICALLRS